jgi:hypothetical protein
MLIIVMVLASWLPIYPASQDKTPSQAHTPSQSNPPKQRPSTSIADQSEQPNRTTSGYAPHPPNKERDWLETAYFYSGPLACLLSLATAVAIWAQIRNHARAERPWILLSMADQFPEFHGDNFSIVAHWKVKNFGKTPALIDSITGAVAVVEDLKIIPALKFTKPFDFACEPVIAPQNESSNVCFKGERISKEIADDLLRQKTSHHVVMAGRVEYRDSFNNRHISNFCYSYVYMPHEAMGFNQMCGPKEYNSYT